MYENVIGELAQIAKENAPKPRPSLWRRFLAPALVTLFTFTSLLGGIGNSLTGGFNNNASAATPSTLSTSFNAAANSEETVKVITEQKLNKSTYFESLKSKVEDNYGVGYGKSAMNHLKRYIDRMDSGEWTFEEFASNTSHLFGLFPYEGHKSHHGKTPMSFDDFKAIHTDNIETTYKTVPVASTAETIVEATDTPVVEDYNMYLSEEWADFYNNNHNDHNHEGHAHGSNNFENITESTYTPNSLELDIIHPAPLETLSKHSRMCFREHPTLKDEDTGKPIWRDHYGVDYAYRGTFVSAQSGTVVGIKKMGGYDKTVAIKNEETGTTFFYAHASKIYVKIGQKVQKGQAIGKTGSGGISSGIHLHLEASQDVVTNDGIKTYRVDPLHLIEQNDRNGPEVTATALNYTWTETTLEHKKTEPSWHKIVKKKYRSSDEYQENYPLEYKGTAYSRAQYAQVRPIYNFTNNPTIDVVMSAENYPGKTPEEAAYNAYNASYGSKTVSTTFTDKTLNYAVDWSEENDRVVLAGNFTSNTLEHRIEDAGLTGDELATPSIQNYLVQSHLNEECDLQEWLDENDPKKAARLKSQVIEKITGQWHAIAKPGQDMRKHNMLFTWQLENALDETKEKYQRGLLPDLTPKPSFTFSWNEESLSSYYTTTVQTDVLRQENWVQPQYVDPISYTMSY